MMVASALAALLLVASPDPLDEARAAFSRGEYVAAERAALDAAVPPREGAALYLAGLARFRAGRPADALELLDRAGAAADPPPSAQWRFNRAACLDELGRVAEAEEEYVAAAAGEGALAPLALVNAGYMALDAGAPERARAHAAAARAAAGQGDGAPRGALELVADLEAQVAGGSGAVATAAASTSSGATASSADARLRPSGDGSVPADRWSGVLRAEGGWDSNPLHAGDFADRRLGATTAEPGSAVGVVEAGVTRRFALGERLRADLSYGLGQLAFAASGARDFSVQQHGVSVGLVASPRDRLHLGAVLEGGLAFAGLSDFRALQRSVGGRVWTAFDPGARTTTRADVGVSVKRGGATEFAYLDGTRVDGGISQELRFGRGSVAAGYRYLRDDVGEAGFSASCGLDCTVTSNIPVGYAGHTGFVSGRLRLTATLELEGLAGLEWRRYLADNRASVTTGTVMGEHHDGIPTGTSSVSSAERRSDLRWFTGESLIWRVTRTFSLVARHELVLNDSNLDGFTPGSRLGPLGGIQAAALGDFGYDKQSVTVGAAVRW